jgi:DNA repair protein RadC
VFSADIKELTNIKGVGKNTAIQIKLIGIAIKRSYEDRHRKLKSYVNLDEVCKMMVEKYYGVNREMVSISC